MIKAIFPAGVTAMTVNGLHQWDYGQKLEIRADDLPTVLELHFSCPGMKEAEVRNCNAPAGVATVSIPDRCLEQSAPITVWVIDIGEDSGTTILGLTLNVTPRLRPASLPGSVQIPESRYNELIAAVNESVESLKKGDVLVSEANHARTADNATHATTADKAYTADEATHATTADTATETETVKHLYFHTVQIEVFLLSRSSYDEVGTLTLHFNFATPTAELGSTLTFASKVLTPPQDTECYYTGYLSFNGKLEPLASYIYEGPHDNPQYHLLRLTTASQGAAVCFMAYDYPVVHTVQLM